MAAIFSAMDRPTYLRLIPQHLRDLATMPKGVLEHLEDGGFSVCLSETDWRGVALVECYEMMINKVSKGALIRPTEQKFQTMFNSYQCVNNLKQQLHPEHDLNTTHKFTHKPTGKDRTEDSNVRAMRESIATHCMFHHVPINKGLWNFLEGKQATEEQKRDMMAIGQRAYVSSSNLQRPSTVAPVRKKQICTFSVSATKKKRLNQVDRERNLFQRYLKRQLT